MLSIAVVDWLTLFFCARLAVTYAILDDSGGLLGLQCFFGVE